MKIQILNWQAFCALTNFLFCGRLFFLLVNKNRETGFKQISPNGLVWTTQVFSIMVALAVKIPEVRSSKAMQISFLQCFISRHFANFHSQKDHKYEIFLCENILHFVLNVSTEYHKICKIPNGRMCILNLIENESLVRRKFAV